jgi:hypothetical protein
MSRFLVLSRSTPEKEELEETAVGILDSFINSKDKVNQYRRRFSQMADWYYEFIKEWDNDHRDQYNEGFFGLRDFYCYIKHVAN